MKTEPIKGRGASTNPGHRFTDEDIEYDIDELTGQLRKPARKILKDHTKGIIATNKSPDIPFDVSVNPYRGCEHGCSYCYARPTHEYLGFSAGLDFETNILVKEDAPRLLERELGRRGYQPDVLVLSGVTDPYQPVERRLELTRRCLE